MPHIWQTCIKTPKTSYLYPDATQIRINVDKRSSCRTRVAVMEGDPVTYALGWYQQMTETHEDFQRIPVVNVANEKRAGGDWESGLMAPEECFARRSNLVHALTMPWNAQMNREENFYPIPQKGGIYTPQVCELRHQVSMTRAYSDREQLCFELGQNRTTQSSRRWLLFLSYQLHQCAGRSWTSPTANIHSHKRRS